MNQGDEPEQNDWRDQTLAGVRRIIHEADPDVVEEVKWSKARSPSTPYPRPPKSATLSAKEIAP